MLKPEFMRERDVMEELYWLGQRGMPVDAGITSVERVNGEMTWALTFPDFPGVKGVCPASEAGVSEKVLPRLVGQTVRVLVKGVDREMGLAACSRREVVEKAKEELVNVLKEGQVIDAAVRAVLPPAEGSKAPTLVLDIGGGVMVEVPRKEAVRWVSKSLSEQYRPGDAVKAKVLSCDPLTVSVRQAYPDPFTCTVFYRGQEIACTVAGVWDMKQGQKIVLIEPDAAPGMLGIAPYPLLGEVARGDRLICVVATYRPEKKQLRCRIRGWA